MWENIFLIYLKVVMIVVAISLFLVGGFLPVVLAIANNCGWWYLFYLLSPMFFMGGIAMFEMAGDKIGRAHV